MESKISYMGMIKPKGAKPDFHTKNEVELGQEDIKSGDDIVKFDGGVPALIQPTDVDGGHRGASGARKNKIYGSGMYYNNVECK